MKLTLTKKEEKNFLFYFRLLVHTLLLCVIAASIALLFELTASSEG